MLQYSYTWGNEDVLSSSIEIIKESNDIYHIYFKQGAFDDKLFRSVKITYGKIINESAEDIVDKLNDIITREIKIKIIAPCNPRPESLFEVLY